MDDYYTINKDSVNTNVASMKKTDQITFQKAMKLTVLIGQLFGLNPVLGIGAANSLKLRFTIFSVRCLYSIISMLGQSGLVICCILNCLLSENTSLYQKTTIFFYVTNFVSTILFFRLARRWPALCQKIEKVESTDLTNDKSLVMKCNISCILILLLALLEHIFANLNGLVNFCGKSDMNFYDTYILITFPWVFKFVPYNILFGVLTQLFNFQCTFNWNFSDVFIICISWYLASRIDQVNKKLMDVKGKTVPFYYWKEIREDYTRATELVIRVGDSISGIVFLSFANNIFIICMQLLHTVDEGVGATPSCNESADNRPLRGYEQAVYFVYSFSFLMARSMAVSLIASKVHTSSLEPANILYHVPASSYCEEVKRLLDQIKGDVVALHGLKFFYVKRGIILTIAAAIVTYELVLMQIAGVSPK